MFESSVMHQKVLYIVSCLGSGISYSPFKANNPASSTQILKARHGFKEHLQISRRRRDQGQLTDQLRAMISCAAIFELLVDGFDAARSVFEESFAMGLPGFLFINGHSQLYVIVERSVGNLICHSYSCAFDMDFSPAMHDEVDVFALCACLFMHMYIGFFQ